MPSPFPGMDPFLENQEWEDFHGRFNTAISEVLNRSINPDYFVRIERRVYVEHVGADIETMRRADVSIVARNTGPAAGLQVGRQESIRWRPVRRGVVRGRQCRLCS